MDSHDPSGVSRILIVEDNRDAADATAMLLRMHGFDVAVAYDGRSALRTAKGYDPDVVLLDLSLPDIDGYAVAVGLRRDGVARASLVAISGFTPDPDLDDSWFADRLIKPVGNDDLLALLSRVQGAPPCAR